MAKRPQVSSIWHCEVCTVQVCVRGHPARLRHQRCQKFMTFVAEVREPPAPTPAPRDARR
jgi:hypothetical protein